MAFSTHHYRVGIHAAAHCLDINSGHPEPRRDRSMRSSEILEPLVAAIRRDEPVRVSCLSVVARAHTRDLTCTATVAGVVACCLVVRLELTALAVNVLATER